MQRLNQQNNNGTSNSNLTPPGAGSGAQASPSRVSLRDKIAKFEQRGGTPIPRGSFGMGAPPPEDASSRKKGELLGNRVPGLNKPTISLASDRSAPPSASTKSFTRQRYTSTSDLDFSPPETPSEFGLKVRSPTMAATVSGRVGMLEVASAGAVDSFPDSGFISATSSPRRNSIAGRRTVSDSYGPYGLSSPPAPENNALAADVAQSPNDLVVQEVKQLSSEPELLEPSERQSAAAPDAIDSTAGAVPTIAAVAEEPKETTSTSTKTTEVGLKIDVPIPEADTQPSQPVTANSSLTPNPATPFTPATANTAVSVDDSFALDISMAEIITAHAEVLSPPSKAVLVPVPPASSPPPAAVEAIPVADAVTSSPPSGSSNLKPIGESQPKLRKKVYANSGPGFQELSLTPKVPSRKSFTAVVHKKDKDSVSTTRSSSETVPPPRLPITPARSKMVTAENELPPASPGAGELAWLVAEAAMLEKQLGVDTSSNEELAEPDYTVPLFTRPKTPAQTPVPELVRDDASSEQTDPTPSTYSPYPVPTVREIGEEEAEDEFSPLSSAKSTRSRKLSSKIKSLASTSSSTLRSLSSSNSRPSISSEMSSEESNRGRRSPQPSEDNGSLSSSRWSLSPKKTPLSRATSFADRIMNRGAKTKSTYLDDSTGWTR